MKAKKFLALFLMLAMLIGMMPTMVLDLHAEEHAWNPNATMTLSCGDEVIEPAEVIETADTKLKIYHVESINDYTLTTSADNDYAVLFEISLTVLEEDEYGYKDYDYEMTITLDNVHIATYNPRADQNAGVHAAMMFSDRTAENRYETLTIELVGDNTVELLGVENDSDADVWSAVAFAAPNTVINGEGTLNATCRYDGAVGAVSAVYTENTIGLYDTVTLNATADVKAQQADKLMGDGLYFHNMNFISEAGTTVNVQASGSGIVHNTETVRPKYLDNLDVGGDLHIRAADYGINWPAGRIYLGDGASMSIAGLTEGSAANVGILTRRDVSIGENCNVTIDALGAAFSCQVTTTANPSAPLSIGKSSVVRMSGSVTSSDFVIDCGTKLSGTNNVVSGTGEEWYGESWNFSELVLAENAQLTIAGGYRALQAAAMELNTGASLTVVTTDVVDSTSVYDYGPVYLSTNSSYIYSGATFSVETPAPTAVYGYSKLNLESNDVYIKAGKTAISNTVARGTGIFTFESDNGATWTPFANSSKKAYFTTREPATHTCAASRDANSYSEKVWTPIEGEHKHTATCIYCAAEIVADCQWDRGAWTYNSGVYTLKFECEICEQERYSDVEYHSHVYETWTAMTGTTSPMHESTCTVPGCGASTEDYCSNSYGPEYHISYNTMRKDCTKCGQYTVWEFDSSQISTTHVQAKPASCAGVGNVEFWYCEHCNCYYADESCTSVLEPADAFIQPTGHTYGADGLCAACGHKNRTLSFVPEEDFPNQYEYYYVMIGKTSQGKYYVLGNNTVNGKREAVLIPDELIAADGTITLSADMAEFLYRETVGTSNVAWMADGGCFTFTAKDGFYLYDKAHYGDGCVPYPGYFYPSYDYDQPGMGKMYAYDKDYSKRVWMYFDEENLCFDVSESEIDNVYIYIQLCDHENLAHNPAVKPTCTEQGSREYYCCGKCYSYFADANASTPYEFPEYIDPYDSYAINEYFQLPATGHKFDSEGVCEYCTMKRNVYRPVTSLEQFDQLSKDAYYIIVFRVGEKLYAVRLPNLYNPCDADSDKDGIVDIMEDDLNANGIPDCIESYIDNYWGGADMNEDGVTTVEEYNEAIGDWNDDGYVTADDYPIFFECYVYWDLYSYYDEIAYSADNFVEVTPAPDGTITLGDEGALEFQMMESGVWGGQAYDDESLAYDKEHNGILDTDRLRAAWIPNVWIANDGMLGYYGEGHLMMQNRWFGDAASPGITDNKNWKISFNADGTALLVSSWTDFDNTGALQFVQYINENGELDMTVVGVPQEHWQYSDVMSNYVAILPAYLFASEPEYVTPPHTCDFGEWVDDENGDTHTRTCKDPECGKVEREPHNWNDGVQSGTPTCTEGAIILYTCNDCGATYKKDVESLGHEWSDWEAYDQDLHRMHCTVCNDYKEEAHNWDGGVETTFATCNSTGIMTYTCRTCHYTKTEETPVLEHTWTDWEPDGDRNHKRECLADDCNAVETLPHEWDDGEITQEPSCSATGTVTYGCLTCWHTKTEELPKTDHQWGEWLVNKTDEANTHIRYCICDEVQSAPHNFDAGVVTEKPTHTEKGLVTFTCADCNYTYTEEIPETEEHAFGDWQPDATVSGKHYRECACGERESGDCIWDEGVPGVGTVEGSYFMDYTCRVCGAHSTKDVRGSRVHFENCEGMNQNPMTFIQTSDEATYQLTLPTAQDVAQREGYVLIGWQASIDGVTYAPGAELYISYEENPTITFSAVWAQVLGQGEQKLSKDQAYVTDMEAFELEGEGVTYRGDQVFYVPKDGIYALIDAKNDKEVE